MPIGKWIFSRAPPPALRPPTCTLAGRLVRPSSPAWRSERSTTSAPSLIDGGFGRESPPAERGHRMTPPEHDLPPPPRPLLLVACADRFENAAAAALEAASAAAAACCAAVRMALAALASRHKSASVESLTSVNASTLVKSGDSICACSGCSGNRCDCDRCASESPL